eukprot:TRINITY_DN67499_c0_g1_i1.p1 TRINITY_DN67499_c0_g1~~TRINITY_DN67499_c0_g1_i1.p1  ORF type:complete len:781 (-),score=109.04 TRINITY_DN67499_c0_g1_i1:543-2885(-)
MDAGSHASGAFMEAFERQFVGNNRSSGMDGFPVDGGEDASFAALGATVYSIRRDVDKLSIAVSECSAAAGATAVAECDRRLSSLAESLVMKVEQIEVRLFQDIMEHVRAVEAACQTSVAAARDDAESATKALARLSDDLSRERSERCEALADISRRTEVDVPPAADGTANDSVIDRNAKLAARFVGGVFPGGNSDQLALAACIGEFDAELRVELNDRCNRMTAELRHEISARIGSMEDLLSQFTGGTRGETYSLDARVKALEDARLDLRLGALESGAQYSSALKAVSSRPSVAPGSVESQAHSSIVKNVGRGENSSSDTVSAAAAAQEVAATAAAATSAAAAAVAAMGTSEKLSGRGLAPVNERSFAHESVNHTRTSDVLRAPTCNIAFCDEDLDISRPAVVFHDHQSSLFGESASQTGGGELTDARVEAQMSNRFADLLVDHSTVATAMLPQEGPEQGYRVGAGTSAAYEETILTELSAGQPLISDELKERLEVLVHQVKTTLNRAQDSSTPVPEEQNQYGHERRLSNYNQSHVDVDASTRTIHESFSARQLTMPSTSIDSGHSQRMFAPVNQMSARGNTQLGSMSGGSIFGGAAAVGALAGSSLVPSRSMSVSVKHHAVDVQPQYEVMRRPSEPVPLSVVAPTPPPAPVGPIGILKQIIVHEPVLDQVLRERSMSPGRVRVSSPARGRAMSPLRRAGSPVRVVSPVRAVSPVRTGRSQSPVRVVHQMAPLAVPGTIQTPVQPQRQLGFQPSQQGTAVVNDPASPSIHGRFVGGFLGRR